MNVACVKCGKPCSPGPRCDDCTPALKKRDDFYGTAKWRRTSLAFRRKFPWCAKCEAEGKRALAEQVHHEPDRRTLERRGLDPYAFEYLVGLCRRHHLGSDPKWTWPTDEFGRMNDPA